MHRLWVNCGTKSRKAHVPDTAIDSPPPPLDEDGLAQHLKPGSLVVDMTTGDPTATREMAAALKPRGIHLIDAPVSGGPHGADTGTIAIMVGAPPELFARIQPILAAISPNI